MPQDPLNVLFVEPRYPGRLGPVADWLVRCRGYRCWFYYNKVEPREHWPNSPGPALEMVHFGVGGVAREQVVPWARHLERGMCYAYGAYEVMDMKRPRPLDAIVGRSAGLGSTLFASLIYPGLPVINYFDGFLRPRKNDLADEDAPHLPAEYVHWRRAANAMDFLDLENRVVPWAPSSWQRGLYPREYHDDFFVLFEGVDTRRFEDRAGPRVVAGRRLDEGTRLVTFVTRVPDRLRGFDRFLTLANRLIRERSDVVCACVGQGVVERMHDVRFPGKDYAQGLLDADPPSDPSRLWRFGNVPRGVVAELLRASDLHVYPSRPFAVSRSMVEAMAAGSVVMAWDSEPVREFVEPDRTGLIVPTDDPEAAYRQAVEVLDDPGRFRPVGEAAAEAARERFSHDVLLPRLASRLDALTGSR